MDKEFERVVSMGATPIFEPRNEPCGIFKPEGVFCMGIVLFKIPFTHMNNTFIHCCVKVKL